MAHQKITYALILLLFGIIFSSCKKKLSKEDTTVEWIVINPVTNTPYVGVPVRLSLIDFGGNSGVESGVIFEGVTDSQGRLSYTFKAYESADFTYWGEYDQNYFNSTGLEYAILKQPSPGEFNKDVHNELRYEIVPYIEAVRHIKNFNCQGEGDVMKYRYKSIITLSQNWTNWISSSTTVGCADYTSGVNSIPMDKRVIEIEVTRQDSSIEQYIDTFVVGIQGTVDTIKIYY